MINLFSSASAVTPGAEFDVVYPTTILTDGLSDAGEFIKLEIQKADSSFKSVKLIRAGIIVISAPGHYRVSKLATLNVVSVDYVS